MSPAAEQLSTRLSGPIFVGKDILELLTSAMYVDPLSIYREYVQNAADALDDATEQGLRPNGTAAHIEITTNTADRSAVIRDYGAGLARSAFVRTLTAIGGSRKRGTSARGFRGVGRLAGLAYCQELIMRSKSATDERISVMQWDCRRLKELLRESSDLSLGEILSGIVAVKTQPADGFPDHFFEVEMRNVVRYKNDLLLNDAALSAYLSQVAPVPFCPSFSFGSRIQKFLDEHRVGTAYGLTINGAPTFRPYQDSYEVSPKLRGKFTDLELFKVVGLSDAIDAVGWILHGDYLGAIPDRHGIKGLRLRSGNLQIGDARLLDSVFPEVRFNSWVVGECHILSPRLVPNARRDDLEQNTHYSNLLGHLTPRAKAAAKACRDRSSERARNRLGTVVAETANGEGVDWARTRAFIIKNADKPVSSVHKSSLLKVLRNGSITYADLMKLLSQPLPAGNGSK